VKLVSSRANAAFKLLLKLKESARARRNEHLALLDGAHLVATYLERVGVPHALAVTGAAARTPAIQALIKRGPPGASLVLSDALFGKLSSLTTPVGILAAVAVPAARDVPREVACCLLLEDIQDPGNLGSILRSAAAAGVEHVLLSRSCADPWSPRVLRAAMGAHFFLNVVEASDLIAFAESYPGQVIATAATATRSIFEIDLRLSTAFLIGNEGVGLSARLLAAADVQAAVPMPGGMESINVGAASAVCLFERVRQLGAAALRASGVPGSAGQ
jgi:TrmH family RNA methyltransferase